MPTQVVNRTEIKATVDSHILAQAGTAILAQANQAGQGILKLLG